MSRLNSRNRDIYSTNINNDILNTINFQKQLHKAKELHIDSKRPELVLANVTPSQQVNSKAELLSNPSVRTNMALEQINKFAYEHDARSILNEITNSGLIYQFLDHSDQFIKSLKGKKLNLQEFKAHWRQFIENDIHNPSISVVPVPSYLSINKNIENNEKKKEEELFFNKIGQNKRRINTDILNIRKEKKNIANFHKLNTFLHKQENRENIENIENLENMVNKTVLKQAIKLAKNQNREIANTNVLNSNVLRSLQEDYNKAQRNKELKAASHPFGTTKAGKPKLKPGPKPKSFNKIK